jgi:predicted ArsR family transcriptional regulator
VPLDRLAAAGDPRLRRVLVYARVRREPFTAADAATSLGVHRNVARNRLDRLVDAGFLEVAHERPEGRSGPGAGRPAKVYRVAPELEGVEFPDRHLAELIGLLVRSVPARGRRRALREAGEEFGRELAATSGLKPARTVAAGLERVCEALGSLGFAVSVRSFEADRAELVSPTCPLRPVIIKCPDAAGLDQGMWAGLAERAVRDVSSDRVTCETPTCLVEDAACSVLLSLGLRADEAANVPGR